MTQQINLNEYQNFVEKVTSPESNDTQILIRRLRDLETQGLINPALLLTAAIGMAAEGGEFAELPKKIMFQGKPVDADVIFHMKRELGDVIWYWINACRALKLDPNEVFAENVRKLESRYPSGGFAIFQSENRADGDI